MAPKRLLQDPPAAASSMDEDSDDDETLDEEEEEVQNQNDVVEDQKDESGDEEEDEDDDDDEEEENVDAKKPNVPNPESESASDADSETESDDMNHSPSASDFTVKPIISKPTAAPAKKRAAAEGDSNPKDSKKKKAANGGASGGDDEDTKKGGQGRLWGEDDEIAILEGMIEFKAKRGTDPSSNMVGFHEFLKKSLKVDVSKNQLMDKARRLKKKYRTNAAKGEDAVFPKAHELKSFELSKRIWGVEANVGNDGGENGKKKPRKSAEAEGNNKKPATVLALPAADSAEKSAVRNNVEKKVEVNVANGGVKAEPEEFWTKYPNLSESLWVGSCESKWEGLERVSHCMPSIGSSKAKGLDDRWRKLRVSEMELAVKKLDLMHEQAKLALEVMKSSKD